MRLRCKEIAKMRCLGMDGAARPFYNYDKAAPAHSRALPAQPGARAATTPLAPHDPREGFN